MPSLEVEMQFQSDERNSKDYEFGGVAWRYNEIWYAICVAECVFSTGPADLFGYELLGFDPDVHYDESLSEESEADANPAAKATAGNGKPTTSLQAKDPVGKQAKGPTQTGLLAKATKASVPTAVGKVPRTSPSVTSSMTVSTSAKATTSSSAKASPGIVKVTSTPGTRMKAMPPCSSLVPLPLSATSKLRQLSESTTSDNSPGKSVSDRTRKKTNGSEITEEEWKFAKVKLAKVKDALVHMTM